MLYRVFDGHCDTPVELWLQEKQLRSSDLAVSLDKAAGLGGYAQFFAFCTAWIETRMPHTEHFSRALDYFLAQLRKNEDRITLCRTAPEAEAAMQAGKCAAFLAIEGAEAVREDEGLLELAYEAGVRMVSLVWNLPNSLSGSCQTGEGHLALGADLDGCSVLPEGFAALNDYETLGRYLADAGYPDETIQNLFCNSLMKVVKTCIM